VDLIIHTYHIGPDSEARYCYYLIQKLCLSSPKSEQKHPSPYVYASALSWVQLLVAPWIVAHQTPLSMGFFRQEYWSGLPFPYVTLSIPCDLFVPQVSNF